MIDRYFRSPVFWDYTLAGLVTVGIWGLFLKHSIRLPKEQYIWSMASDLTTIALTLSGFILTLLTVLITFKSGSKVNKSSIAEQDSIFELFFATDLYFQTVKHLKNCIKSLITIAVIGFSLKLFLDECNHKYIYFFNVLGLIIIVLTIIRSLLILTKIINLQKLGS